MKKVLIIVFSLCLSHLSCSQTSKQIGIQKFKVEIQRLNDSSAIYFDKGIKLLKAGENKEEIAKILKPKLRYYEIQIDSLVRNFYNKARKLKLTEAEYNAVFEELKKKINSNLEKYKFLSENGVNITN